MLATKERIIAQRQFETERYILSTNPFFYAPLYKLDGSSFSSQDGGGHLCTVTGALWTLQGRLFDTDAGDFIALPSAVYQAFANTNDFTMEAWAHLPDPANLKGYTLTFNGDSAPNQPTIWLYFGSFNGGSYGFQVRQTLGSAVQNRAGKTGLTVGFHHMVGMWDAALNKAIIYVDGEYGGEDATNVLTFAKTDFDWGDIGKLMGGSGSANSWIGEVRIYNRVLLPQEIQSNYLATKWRYA